MTASDNRCTTATKNAEGNWQTGWPAGQRESLVAFQSNKMTPVEVMDLLNARQVGFAAVWHHLLPRGLLAFSVTVAAVCSIKPAALVARGIGAWSAGLFVWHCICFLNFRVHIQH